LSIPQSLPALRIERFEGGQRVVESLVYNDASAKRKVSDGELIVVLPPSPKIANSVTLRGHVAKPLRHSWFEGMRVSDLLGQPADLVRPSSWVKRNERDSLSKLGLTDRDNDFKRDFPEVNWEYAAIERLDPQSTVSTLHPFDLGKAMGKHPEHDLKLQAGDAVVVFARADFQQPQAKRYKVIRIEGEVKVPGVYPITDGESLAQVVEKAGGLMPRAYLMGTVLVRQSARQQEAERLRMVVDRIERDALRFLSSRSRYAVNAEEAMSGANEVESVQQLINRLRSVQAQGRIPLPWGSPDATLASLVPVALEDEDRILIPHRPSTVTVVGAVFQEGSQLWEKASTVSDYLERAGGFQRYADTSAVVLVRADGSVRKVGGWFGGKHVVYPGDTLLVPEDVRSSGWTKSFKDWTQIFYQLGLGAAALKILTGGQL
jgi:protein involved in polysaccharide export with SLBB domain